MPSTQDDHTNSVEQKKAELLKQETNKDLEITQDQLSIGKRLLNWRTIVPLVIAIIALVIFAQKININPKITLVAMRNANVYFVLAAFLIYYLSFPIRTFRWRMLLENIGYTKENGIQLPKFWKLLEIIYVSWFANVIVPAKLGDLYRPYLLRREAGLPASRTFGTVLAERLLDLVVLLLLFIPSVIISLHENLPPQLVLGLKITMVLVVVGIIGLFMLRRRAALHDVRHLAPGHFRALLPCARGAGPVTRRRHQHGRGDQEHHYQTGDHACLKPVTAPPQWVAVPPERPGPAYRLLHTAPPRGPGL